MRLHHNLVGHKALPQMHGTLLSQSAAGFCTLALSLRYLQPPAHKPSFCPDHPNRLQHKQLTPGRSTPTPRPLLQSWSSIFIPCYRRVVHRAYSKLHAWMALQLQPDCHRSCRLHSVSGSMFWTVFTLRMYAARAPEGAQPGPAEQPPRPPRTARPEQHRLRPSPGAVVWRLHAAAHLPWQPGRRPAFHLHPGAK